MIISNLDFRISWSDEELAAVEADAAEDLLRLGEEAGVEHGLGQVDVPEMSGTLGHVAGAGLAPKIVKFLTSNSK